ncbi:MAG: hypothetical protein IKX40_03595 [Thermoguttaceae bacterium]|nr:hypothetical protein [Thermoguttaceae bacterium]
MDTENSNSTPQTERDRINEQLDELRQSQQERKPQKKTRPRWKRRLLGFLGVISGLFLLGTSCSKPTVTCYRHADPEDEEEAPVEEEDEILNAPDDRVRTMCYYRINVSDNNSSYDNGNSDSDSLYDFLAPNWEPQSSDEEADPGLEEVQQYYEKVKQESSVNNVDNAETNDNSDTPTEE